MHARVLFVRFSSLLGLALALACGGADDAPADGGGADGGGSVRDNLPPFICSSYQDCPMQPGGADDSACTDTFPGGACLLDSEATCDRTSCPTGSACVSFRGDLYCLRTCEQGCKVGQTCSILEGVCLPADCSADESVCGPYPCMEVGAAKLCTRIFCPSVGACPPPFSCNRETGVCEEPRYTPSSE